MKPYKNLDENSKIELYEYEDNYITFLFKDGIKRNYTNESVTPFILNNLKTLADLGHGLDEYLKEVDPQNINAL